MKKPIRITILIFLTVGVSSLLHGWNLQTTTSIKSGAIALKRDPDGVAILSKVVSSLGGDKAVQTEDFVATGQIQSTDESGTTVTKQFTWKDKGGDFRRVTSDGTTTKDTASSGNKVKVDIGDGNGAKSVKNSPVGFIPLHLIARVLAKALNNNKVGIEIKDTEIWNKQTVIRIHIWYGTHPVTAKLTNQEWLINAQNGIPLRVEYQIVDGNSALVSTPMAAEFTDYRIVDGIAIPHSIITYSNGKKDSTVTIISVKTNQGLSPTEFQLNGGAQ